MDACVADTSCIGLNYTRKYNGEIVNYFHSFPSRKDTVGIENIDGIDESLWDLRVVLLGNNDSFSVQAGNEIVISFIGTAAPFPTQSSPALINSYPLGQNGEQLLPDRPRTGLAQGYLAPFTGANKAQDFYKIKAAIPHLYGQKWTVSIPNHQSGHDNNAGYFVKVWTRKNE